jgi:putative transferase (TIGR04331 family)
MKNKTLLLDGDLPESIHGATIYVLHSDRALRLASQATKQSCTIQVLPIEAETRAAFAEDATFERKRYEKYIPLLSSRLREIHGIDRPDLYWERVLGFTLLIHIYNCRRVFRAGQLVADHGMSVTVTDQSAINLEHIPSDELEHREFFENGDGCDEQLMHVYLDQLQDKVPIRGRKISPGGPIKIIPSSSAFSSLKFYIDSIWRNRSIVFQEFIVRLVRLLVSPKVLLLNVHWEKKARQHLELRSRGKVQACHLSLKTGAYENQINWEARAIFSKAPSGSDDFDNFFFSSLLHAAPSTWLETFSERVKSTRAFLKGFPKLTHLANETLDEDSLLVIAEAAELNITTIHTEHNYLQQQYLGNIVWYILRKVDLFLSLGWSSPTSEKVIPAGSNFNWIERGVKKVADIPILYIGDCAFVKPPMCSAGYGECGSPNAKRYIESKQSFFSALSPDIKAKIYYRDYPEFKRSLLPVHHLDDIFRDEYHSQFGTVDADGRIKMTALLARCRILVVDYLSTPYLQGLLGNIPMIVLLNQDSYYLDDSYLDFFDDVIAAGIFHTDPVSAAAFLSRVVDDPNRWWQGSSVQAARRSFVEQNIGKPEDLNRRLIAFSNEKLG